MILPAGCAASWVCFCGVDSWSQVEQLHLFLAQLLMHISSWAPLSWLPVVMTLVGAAEAEQIPVSKQHLANSSFDFLDNFIFAMGQIACAASQH